VESFIRIEIKITFLLDLKEGGREGGREGEERGGEGWVRERQRGGAKTFDGTHPLPVALASFCLFKSNCSNNRREEG
jgi:hypothetical protein